MKLNILKVAFIVLIVFAIGGVVWMINQSRTNQNQTSSKQQSQGGFANVSPQEGYRLIKENQSNPNFVVLDVRTPAEYAAGHIAGAVLIDFYSPDFRQRLNRLDKERTYFVYCRSGNRSGQVLEMMRQDKFRQAYNLSGGIGRWIEAGLAIVK